MAITLFESSSHFIFVLFVSFVVGLIEFSGPCFEWRMTKYTRRTLGFELKPGAADRSHATPGNRSLLGSHGDTEPRRKMEFITAR